jgi:hypothetical protein
MNILDKAVAACQRALSLRPDDNGLKDEYKNLTAELTMVKGHYDGTGDFRKSIKDKEKQEHLYSQERVVKTEKWRDLAIKEARKALVQDPTHHKNIVNLANALADQETEAATQEAVSLLEKAYQDQNDFSFKDKADQLVIRQLRRQIRQMAKDSPERQALETQLQETELEHYRLCVENYPTDLKYKYEYGLRLMSAERYDQAIPYFQESRRDPGRRLLSMNQIGLAFLSKGWLTDATDVFQEALSLHETKDDALGKELRYHLARVYEEQGSLENALDIYRKIAQADFAYRDVSERVTKLREA